ncbi:hypothetical protein [Anaerovibrio sp.]|uniref:hypothetical protein n=1 Tax=Anaerovibrio sp. TaxID=1872532 RepID=UPI0025C4125F|nr:hypothetical protein [Anaerovibrio sp.]MBR2143379.1 hypothetical protein [Anaerovibrio sp.]
MRLGDYLSREPSSKYEQVEKFAGDRKLPLGKPKKIDIGQIALNFLCMSCKNIRTFVSQNNIQMIPITNSLISIDSRLSCPVCNESVAAWFIIDIEGDIMSLSPKVRLLKRNIKYTDNVCPTENKYGKYSEWLAKANIAYQEELGAGSIVYLRKIFESVTYEVADVNGINISDRNGKRLNFKETLDRVCKQVDFIPQEFSKDGYKLFSELSNVVHGDFKEAEGLTKYPALFRLVQGVLDKQIDSIEIKGAKTVLGWNSVTDN